eukprot:9974758-Ditylum_brightwellii.AAC.1
MSLVHWEHDVSREGGGGGVRGTMVQHKGEMWGITGNSNFCPLKPMQWKPSPIHKRRKACVYSPGG